MGKQIPLSINMPGVSVRDVPAQEFINAYAKFLQRQGKLEVPGYVDLVKTSAGNELPPQEAETWFYKRAASIARHIYLRKQVGVGALNKLYGGAKNRGFRPHKHVDASGLSTERLFKVCKRLVSWKFLQKVVEEFPKTVKEIWTVSLLKLWKMKKKIKRRLIT